jgi:NADH dehydrogenase [ubiquinone] 1 alpha subcomplex assembly factor 7
MPDPFRNPDPSMPADATQENETPLACLLKQQIAAEGPLRLDHFLQRASSDPEYGYYMCRQPFGTRGDFTTAPEISQMFGELVGLWCADLNLRRKDGKSYTLVELGPGRGTLMADALRAIKQTVSAHAAQPFHVQQVHLVEASPRLIAEQRKNLRDAPVWHESIATLPEEPLLVIANEFFDALPIRQFEYTCAGWQERYVGLNAQRELTFQLLPLEDITWPESLPGHAAPGSIKEIGETAGIMLRSLIRRLLRCGGALLIVDYGPSAGGLGNTLQAVARHAYAHPLRSAGEADITAHVDFAALSEIALSEGARIYGPIGQGQFLRALGIAQRAKRLLKGAETDQAHLICSAVHRLTSSDEMGALFKVLCITGRNDPVPAGFSSAADHEQD